MLLSLFIYYIRDDRFFEHMYNIFYKIERQSIFCFDSLKYFNKAITRSFVLSRYFGILFLSVNASVYIMHDDS